MPLSAEFFALEGLSQLLQTVERIRSRFNPELSILGVALTMYDRRNNLASQVADDVRACLGHVVFDTSSRATSACPRRRATAFRPDLRPSLPGLGSLYGAGPRADRAAAAQGQGGGMSDDRRAV